MTSGTAAGPVGAGATAGISADERWAAGFEMGRLDQQLAARRRERVGLTIPDRRREEAAAIARRHGYELHVQAVEEPGRVWAEFWPEPGTPR